MENEKDNTTDALLKTVAVKIRDLCNEYLEDEISFNFFSKYLKKYTNVLCSFSSFKTIIKKVDNFFFG